VGGGGGGSRMHHFALPTLKAHRGTPHMWMGRDGGSPTQHPSETSCQVMRREGGREVHVKWGESMQLRLLTAALLTEALLARPLTIQPRPPCLLVQVLREVADHMLDDVQYGCRVPKVRAPHRQKPASRNSTPHTLLCPMAGIRHCVR
jgi:hypothetical protein